jgi:pimeloyl-ACP methyl ester carboxylesterase
VQGYLGNHDQAHSMLDSARALRALLPAGILDERVLLVGYSQGGGAVLASQGLERSYGSGGKIDAVVVFAAEWVSRIDSLQLVHTLESPDSLTISTGITVPVVTAMRDYAFGYNVLGPDASMATFSSGNASGIASALMSLCQVPFGGYIQGVAVHVGDIFDDGYRSSLLACIHPDAGGDASCSGTGQRFYDWLTSDLVAPDPSGAPVLYVQGLSDTIMPPSQEGACNIGVLQDAGVPVQLCTDQAASHTDVVARNVPFAISWANAKLYGGSTPTCSSMGMPACQP